MLDIGARKDMPHFFWNLVVLIDSTLLSVSAATPLKNIEYNFKEDSGGYATSHIPICPICLKSPEITTNYVLSFHLALCLGLRLWIWCSMAVVPCCSRFQHFDGPWSYFTGFPF